MIERMRSSDDDEIPASVPSSSLPPKAASSSGRPPRAPTSARPLVNNGSKSKSTTSRRDRKSKEGDVEEEQGSTPGFMSSVRKAIDASVASATTCLIPGSQCGDIEHGDFDLGRIDDVAQKLYTRARCGGGEDGKKTQQAATFDDDNTLFSETQTLGTVYTGYTGATGFTGGSAASAGASTFGRHAHRANANNNDCDDDDLVGDEDDTIEDGNSTGMTRSSTFQTTLTMNTLNSASIIGASGPGGVGSTVGTSKIPTAIGAGDGGMRYESETGSSAPVRQRTQSTHRSEKTEPTGSNRSSAVVRGEQESLLVNDGESAGIELELGKEPKNMPSTAVDIDECSVSDGEMDLDVTGTTAANNEIQHDIMFVQQNEPLVASRCPGYSGEIEGFGEEISFDAFKAGLEESLNDGKDAQKAGDGLVMAKTKRIDENAGGRRNASEKKKRIPPPKKPPFFAAPPKKVPPPAFFSSTSS